MMITDEDDGNSETWWQWSGSMAMVTSGIWNNSLIVDGAGVLTPPMMKMVMMTMNGEMVMVQWHGHGNQWVKWQWQQPALEATQALKYDDGWSKMMRVKMSMKDELVMALWQWQWRMDVLVNHVIDWWWSKLLPCSQFLKPPWSPYWTNRMAKENPPSTPD